MKIITISFLILSPLIIFSQTVCNCNITEDLSNQLYLIGKSDRQNRLLMYQKNAGEKYD